MLRHLFQAIEQALGSSLDTVATVVFWAGVLLVLHRIASTLFRLYMEIASARLKVRESLVVECPHCHRETIVQGSQCAFCRQSVHLPLAVRAWHFVHLRRQAAWWRRCRWTWDSIGIAVFLVLTIAGVLVTHAWTPAGPLQKLFIGMALLSWVALSWLVGHVLNLGPGGPIARVRDALYACAVSCVLIVSLVFAAEAKPVEEQVMWRIPVAEGGVARIDNQTLKLPQGMIGFEYLQVDHDAFGFHRVIPIAFLGTQRLELQHAGVEKWLIDNLWKHGQGYSERGLSVRSRVEQFIVVPNQTYQVVERDKQIFFRPAPQ
jgi:hypothetical protein